MKLLLTSVDAIVNLDSGEPFPGIIDALNFFEKLDEANQVIVISSHQDKLDLLPDEIAAVKFTSESRGSNSPIDNFLSINSDYNDRSKIIVLAANDADFRTAVNSKLLFLGAGYAKVNNSDSKAYQYGLQVNTVSGLKSFFERFFAVENPWYYRFSIDDNFVMYSLTNANTYYRPDDVVELNNKFKECLKIGNAETRGAFIAYFMMGIYDIVNDIENIDLWGIYPSSTVEQVSDLEQFKELARTTFKIRSKEPLFIRHKKSTKRSNIYNESKRVDDGCENQFETMHINPKYRGKIAGKIIGVIDDFTTYGTSGETVRALLEHEGAAKVVFLTLGKFGKKYYKYDYEIVGDVFTPSYSFKRLKEPTLLEGKANYASDEAFVNSLKGIV